MYSWLVPRLAFPACELVTGRRFWTEVDRLRSRQWATPAELEAKLEPLYSALHMVPGQLEALTGISERRWWGSDYSLARGAAVAGRKAMEASNISPAEIDVLIYAGVCREQLEPATACRVRRRVDSSCANSRPTSRLIPAGGSMPRFGRLRDSAFIASSSRLTRAE